MWDLAFLQDRDVAPGAVLKSRAIAHADEGQDGAAITLHDQLVGHLQGGSGRTTYFRRTDKESMCQRRSVLPYPFAISACTSCTYLSTKELAWRCSSTRSSGLSGWWNRPNATDPFIR